MVNAWEGTISSFCLEQLFLQGTVRVHGKLTLGQYGAKSCKYLWASPNPKR